MTQPNPAPTEPTPPAGDPPAPTNPTPPPAADEPLGPPGLRALQAERERVDALQKELAALAPLKQFAASLGAGTPAADGKNEVQLLTDRLAQHEADLAAERRARWCAEIAAEKGISSQLAARLQGATREELAADADTLAALLPKSPQTPGTPAPDPSQGARGSGADLDAQIKTAQAAGDWRMVIRLQNEKLANHTK